MRTRHAGSFAIIFSAIMIAACAHTGGEGSVSRDSSAATLTGTVAYRERIALTPDAVVEVTLEDVSRADAPAQVVASTRIERPGQPPIPFTLAYDPARIDQSRTYAVRARITAGDRLLFTSTQHTPVLTRGNRREVAIMVQRAGGATKEASPFGPLPATFDGVLPCADCPGIRHQLNLMDDHVFHLRLTYLERPAAGDLDDIGTWLVSPDGRTLILAGGRERQALFAIKGPDTLRMLDLEGNEIESSLPYDLTRTADVPPFAPRLMMTGMYAYLADAATFTECLTGVRYPVAMEADHVALERAYLAAPHAAGEPVLATVEGQLAPRPQADGDGTTPTLVVERFVSVTPGETCPPRFAAAPLGGTQWNLTRLDDREVTGDDPQRRPHLILDEDAHRLAGSGGCNRLLGGYERDGERIKFAGVASTMMACPDMEIEGLFTRALERVATWRILGRMLELRDDAGALVARFEAARP